MAGRNGAEQEMMVANGDSSARLQRDGEPRPQGDGFGGAAADAGGAAV
uniref:Uncharacterized protein n=1 Tax=Arundo donax TaxID=35708 RepID=A0A0A9A9F7_ARUDO